MQIDTERLRSERDHRAWSQEHLAQVSGLGLRTIQRIESSGVASSESALALASAFEMPVSELIIRPATRESVFRRVRFWSGATVAGGFLAVIFFAKLAMAEQIQVNLGLHSDDANLRQKSVVATSGQNVELEFEDNLKAVVTPRLVGDNDIETILITLKIFEQGGAGKDLLLGSFDLVHDDDSNYDIKIHSTISGKIYRLVFDAKLLAG